MTDLDGWFGVQDVPLLGSRLRFELRMADLSKSVRMKRKMMKMKMKMSISRCLRKSFIGVEHGEIDSRDEATRMLSMSSSYSSSSASLSSALLF